jgi:hypothetical protein
VRTFPVNANFFPLGAKIRLKNCPQVVTEGSNVEEAWLKLLGRPFKGLDKPTYRERFETDIGDPYLRSQALQSLKNGCSEQQLKYDFSLRQWQKMSRDGVEGKYLHFRKNFLKGKKK